MAGELCRGVARGQRGLMPHLNRSGQAVCGYAGTPVSVDGAPMGTVGESWWITDDTILTHTTSWLLATLRVPTDLLLTLSGPQIVQPPRGYNFMVAGGGRFLAHAVGWGLTGSLGWKPDATCYSASPDGTLAWKRVYQSGGGLTLSAPDGSEVDVPDAHVVAQEVHVLGPGRAVWTDVNGERGIRSVGVLQPKPALRARSLRYLELFRETWLVYQCSLGLVAQLDGATEGYILESTGHAFNPDAIEIGGEILVCWATSRGEGVGELVKTLVDRTQPRVPLVEPVVVPPINRALWLGWFEFSGRVDLSNCYLPVDSAMLVRRRADEAPIAQYVASEGSGTGPASLELAIADARGRHPTLPVIPYWTANNGRQSGPVPSGDWIGVEAYCGATEPLPQFEARVRAALARVRKAVLIAQCYTSNAGLTRDLVSLVPVYARLLRDVPSVLGCLVFSGSGRATGLQDHPEARPLWESVFATIRGPGPVEVITPPPEEKPMQKPPTFDQWVKHEYPQLLEAFRERHDGNDPGGPPGEWAALLTFRRLSGSIPDFGESWTFQQMLDHERSQGSAPGGGDTRPPKEVP